MIVMWLVWIVLSWLWSASLIMFAMKLYFALKLEMERGERK
jgi:hypothetical protein